VSTSSSVQPILVLLGQHVAGNPTQFMMEKAFERHEIDWRYLSFEVSPEDLGDAVRGLRAMGFRGGNLADPHKQAALPLLDRAGEVAQKTGVVNCWTLDDRAMVGENTEGRGVLDALRRRIDPAGKRIVLLGAGRMARAVGVELALAKAAQIVVVNRSHEHGWELVELLGGPSGVTVSFAPWDDEYSVPADTDVLVSALALAHGETESPLSLGLDQLTANTIVADVTYNPPRTWLLNEGAERGAPTIQGLDIFIEQATINFRLWTGVDPDPTVMREAVEEFLEL
jgi:shikimate dehydrogenase